VLQAGPHCPAEGGYNTLKQAQDDGAVVMAYGYVLSFLLLAGWVGCCGSFFFSFLFFFLLFFSFFVFFFFLFSFLLFSFFLFSFFCCVFGYVLTAGWWL
jgi:hypothetical protein